MYKRQLINIQLGVLLTVLDLMENANRDEEVAADLIKRHRGNDSPNRTIKVGDRDISRK